MDTQEMVKHNGKRFPDFFKVYLSEFSSQRMLIPHSFVRSMNGLIPKKTMLRSSLGEQWHVRVVKTDQGTFFTDGWRLFVEENSIQEGEFLVFCFRGGMFNFVIFGHSMCPKNTPSRNKGKEVEEKEEEEEEEEEEDDHGVDGVGHQQHLQLRNPSFPAKSQSGHRCKLHVPSKVIEDNNLKFETYIIFQDPSNREWRGKVAKWKDGRIWIGDWDLFCRKNVLREDQEFVCEIMLDKYQGHQCGGYNCFHTCDKIKVHVVSKIKDMVVKSESQNHVFVV